MRSWDRQRALVHGWGTEDGLPVLAEAPAVARPLAVAGGKEFPKLYAQSWSLVRFLFDEEENLLRSFLKAGVDSQAVAALEPRWRQYVATLGEGA